MLTCSMMNNHLAVARTVDILHRRRRSSVVVVLSILTILCGSRLMNDKLG